MKTGKCFREMSAKTGAPVLLTVLALGFQTVNSNAQLLAPGDNSSLVVNPSGGNLVQDWTIDGVNILNSASGGFQGLYYQVGSGVPTPIQSGIGALSSTGPTISGDTATLNTTYSTAGNPFSLQTVYSLTGGTPGSGNSTLTEVVNVKNTQATTLSFHFYQYAKFTVPNSTVSLQTSLYRGNSLYTLAEVAGGISLSEYVDGSLNPGASEGSVDPSLVALTTTPGFGLPGPAVNMSGSGSTWLLEWDVNIPANGTFILSKDIYATVPVSPVPEPGTFSLLSLGLLGFGAFSFYRRRFAR
jgi:hypothetical protein